MGRTIGVLSDYRRLMDRAGVVRARLVATSAARDAVNAEEFFSAAEEATGVHPELLSGLEEGRLSFTGAMASLPAVERGSEPVLVVDIGGGSTELVVGVPPSGPDDIPAVAAISLDIGCVRLTERFFHHDPPLGHELTEARALVDAEVERARAALPPVPPGGLLIGLAGTVSTVAALEGQFTGYDRERIHHAVLSRVQVDGWLEKLAGEDREARRWPVSAVAGASSRRTTSSTGWWPVSADLGRPWGRKVPS
jgi:exopolyphosphatase/guanosine-5'-triphosphate,3'-diphosphate pyrophosphatase